MRFRFAPRGRARARLPLLTRPTVVSGLAFPVARLDCDLAVDLEARQLHVVAGADRADAPVDVGPDHVTRVRAPDVAVRVELLDDDCGVHVHDGFVAPAPR